MLGAALCITAKSALPLIATAKAASRERPCLLYPRKQTCAVQSEMSAKGQKRILMGFVLSPSEKSGLFLHLISLFCAN
jgi:hypothetical protein